MASSILAATVVSGGRNFVVYVSKKRVFFSMRVMWFWLCGVLLTVMIFLLLNLGLAFLLVEIFDNVVTPCITIITLILNNIVAGMTPHYSMN
jgi:hypothetical protein